MTLSQPALRAELDILVAFILFRYSRIKPRSKANIAGKPSTAIQAFHALSRIHARHGIILPPFKTLKHHMKGLFQLHADEFGYSSLLPQRKEPIDASLLIKLLSTTELKGKAIDWSNDALYISLAAVFCVASEAGMRKAEVAAANTAEFATGPSERRFRRCDLTWRIGDVYFADPSPEQFKSMVPGVDGCALRVGPSKADPFGLVFGPHPIHFTLGPNESNACARLRHLELMFPLHGSARMRHALFFSDHLLTPLLQSTIDSNLGLLLRVHLPEAAAAARSFHSFRIGLACCLRAAGCSDAIIQALVRWRSPESLQIYARLNPSVRADFITAATRESASSISTANLPTIDADEAFAALSFSFRGTHGRDPLLAADDSDHDEA